MFSLDKLLRDNIRKAEAYSSARDEYEGSEGIFLDANENSLGSVTDPPYHRYPDPLQRPLKEVIAAIKRADVKNIFLGNGSDEPIDLIIRMVCKPGIDNIIIMPPTYGMYQVSAAINDVEVKKVPLSDDFQIRTEAVLEAADEHTKIIFICSPNNPTGNSLKVKDIEEVLNKFNGLVVIDEAYIDFSRHIGFVPRLKEFPNLVILQTLSKAWGMAALRLGMAYASEEIISVFNKIKPPYNINGASQSIALEGLRKVLSKEMMVEQILTERERLKDNLQGLPVVVKIFPSDANFLLVKTTGGKAVYEFLIERKIITRDRSSVVLCEGCLRITVGTPDENDKLISALKEYK
ncbi:histidinol-phosphate transaminase [Cytophagaceae bacterium ABcell3]|nr:histidinol-phosphate transaminase [Cytophagaceae bacterium ABcell3]